VAPRQGFVLHKMAGLRAAAAGGKAIDRVLVPNSKIVHHGKFIESAATSVDPSAKTVTLANGETVKWDVLVIATGSRNVSPAEPGVNVVTKEETRAFYQKVGGQLTKAKNVVVVGNGSVGLELAGEIHEFGQKGVKVTVVGRGATIMAESKYSESALKKVTTYLKTIDVEVLNGEEVSSPALDMDLMTGFPIMETPSGVTLKSGKTIPCDLLVFAAGSQVNTGFLPAEWVDKTTKDVLSDPKTLRLLSRNDVFAVGDCAATVGGVKRGYFAEVDGKICAKNVIQVLNGKEPTGAISRMSLVALSLGPSHGFLILPIMTLGHWVTKSFKSKDLFVSRVWKNLSPGSAVPTMD
jgi:NADH dehydrogenase FAD-containing subunit